MSDKTSDALIIIDKLFGGDPEWDRLVAEESLKLRIGQMVYDVRQEAGLTHAQLAEQIGADPEIIRKIEAADYDAGPIEILIRVCLALRKKVEIDCSGQEPGAKCRVTLLSA